MFVFSKTFHKENNDIKIKNQTHVKKVGHTFFWHLSVNFEKPEKSEFLKNENKLLEISSFYTCVPKATIIWSTVPEIRSYI